MEIALYTSVADIGSTNEGMAKKELAQSATEQKEGKPETE
jgi:hypothetical protein